MTQESDISLLSQEPRYCPGCNMRVATRASECLLCGTSLVEEQAVETDEDEETDVRRVPGWVSSVVVFLLAAMILAGGGYGLYAMLVLRPNSDPTASALPPTSTPTPTATPTPTETPVPTATPTPLPPRAHSVEDGETVSDIAVAYGVSVDQILDLNPDVDPEFIKTGQVLLIPPSAPPSGEVTVHVVQEGETLGSIAEEYAVSVSNLRTANDLSPQNETIRAGQSLVVPLSTPTPDATRSAALSATPTPVPPYPPPPLLYPPDGTVLVGRDAPVLLQWASVSLLQGNEWYELTVAEPAGGVVSDTVRTRTTAWRVPLDLLQGTGASSSRFEWQVQVVRRVAEGIYEQAGDPSEVRTFTWLEPTPTPAPSPTP